MKTYVSCCNCMTECNFNTGRILHSLVPNPGLGNRCSLNLQDTDQAASFYVLGVRTCRSFLCGISFETSFGLCDTFGVCVCILLHPDDGYVQLYNNTAFLLSSNSDCRGGDDMGVTCDQMLPNKLLTN